MARDDKSTDILLRGDEPAATCHAAEIAQQKLLEFARALARIAAREDDAAERIEAGPAASKATAREPKKIG